jgi:hypothetical protein
VLNRIIEGYIDQDMFDHLKKNGIYPKGMVIHQYPDKNGMYKTTTKTNDYKEYGWSRAFKKRFDSEELKSYGEKS